MKRQKSKTTSTEGRLRSSRTRISRNQNRREPLERGVQHKPEAVEGEEERDSQRRRGRTGKTADEHTLPSFSSSGNSEGVVERAGTKSSEAEPTAPLCDPAMVSLRSSSSNTASAAAVTSSGDEIDLETVTLEVSCGENEAQLRLNDLCGGSRRSCVLLGGSWMTPNEFQAVSGRGNAKDWKRSIKHHGRPLKLLFEQGLLSTAPPFCLCDVCDSQGHESDSSERKSIEKKIKVSVKPIKKNGKRTRQRTNMASTAEEGSRPIVRRRRKLNRRTSDDPTAERNPTRKTTRRPKEPTTNRENDWSQNGRQRRRAMTSGKTRKVTGRRSRLGHGGGRKFENRRVKRGRGKRVGVDEKSAAADFHLDDDSRTIIDGEELVAASERPSAEGTPSCRESGEPSAAPDDREDVEGEKNGGSGGMDFRGVVDECGWPKRRRKSSVGSMKKRAKIEEDSKKDTKISGTEREEKKNDKDSEMKKSSENVLEAVVSGIDQSIQSESEKIGRKKQESGEEHKTDRIDRNSKDQIHEIQLCVPSEQNENLDDDVGESESRRTESILCESSFRESKDMQNPPIHEPKDEDKCPLKSLILSSLKNVDAERRPGGKSRLLATDEMPSEASGLSSRGRKRTGRGRGRFSVASKMADSTTISDAKSHAAMISDTTDNRTSEGVNQFNHSISQSAVGQVFATKTKKNREIIRSENPEFESKLSLQSQVETPENRFCEFPVGGFSGTLFRNAPSTADVRFLEMTSQALPVGCSGYFSGIRSDLNFVAVDADVGHPGSRSDFEVRSPPTSSGRAPDAVEARIVKRRHRRQRSGVVSSTTSGFPSAESMTSLYDLQLMTSQYESQATMTSSRRGVYGRSPGGFLSHPGDAGVRPTNDLGHRFRTTEFCFQKDEIGQGQSQGQGLRRFEDWENANVFRSRFQDFVQRNSSNNLGFCRVSDCIEPVSFGMRRKMTPGGSTGEQFVYDDCGALDLTLPKLRSE